MLTRCYAGAGVRKGRNPPYLAMTAPDHCTPREGQTIDQPTQSHERAHEELSIESSSNPSLPDECAEQAPYATRLRVVFLLSILSWAAVLILLLWALRVI